MKWTDLNSSDALAVGMLLTIGFSMMVVFLVLWTVIRNASNRDNGDDELLGEFEDDPIPAPRPKRGNPSDQGDPERKNKPNPWERENDWWKKGKGD